MPVWHEATKRLVAAGKLAVVGVDEEQHPDRCRLYLQWQRIDWPMMSDPINQLGLTGVPVVRAIDEHGIVRLTHPDPKTFEREFVDRQFPPPGAAPDARPQAPVGSTAGAHRRPPAVSGLRLT